MAHGMASIKQHEIKQHGSERAYATSMILNKCTETFNHNSSLTAFPDIIPS
jgi:hypothetical protein